MLRKSKIKSVSGHQWFYTDAQGMFEFYYKLTPLSDWSILVFSVENRSYREYIVDMPSFVAIVSTARGTTITQPKAFVDSTIKLPCYLKDDDNGVLLAHKKGFVNTAQTGIISKSNNLTLKRYVYRDKVIIGVDTITLTKDACVQLVEIFQKTYKGVDIEKDIQEDK